MLANSDASHIHMLDRKPRAQRTTNVVVVSVFVICINSIVVKLVALHSPNTHTRVRVYGSMQMLHDHIVRRPYISITMGLSTAEDDTITVITTLVHRTLTIRAT